jgi:hypothetical protein
MWTGKNEHKFFPKGFNMEDYLEKLVVPFLYEQTFFAKYNRWPWGQLAHGYPGYFEEFLETNEDEINKEYVLKILETMIFYENRKCVSFVLDNTLKGHFPCFCGSGKKIRNCHSVIFKTLTKLRSMIKKYKINTSLLFTNEYLTDDLLRLQLQNIN